VQQIRSCAGNKEIIAVVKDNAYGCGAVQIARTLENNGVSFFAVARFSEALQLRENGITSPVLVLGFASSDELRQGSSHNIVFSLNDKEDLERWSALDIPVQFHCNIDTGMGRLGLQPDEISDTLLTRLSQTPKLLLKGVYTHLACADIPGTASVSRQLDCFNTLLVKIESRVSSPLTIHYGNSAAIMRFDLDRCTHVRPGISLYGCKPDPSQDFSPVLRPILSLKSHVIKIKKVPPGTSISYNARYTTTQETFIATIPLGYAHGYPRFLTNRGFVLIKGKRYQIAGTVTMDYIMIDVGPSPDVQPGDIVTAIGSDQIETITADAIALQGSTIGYEILCNLNKSLHRVYLFD
jgi:alanine racemase